MKSLIVVFFVFSAVTAEELLCTPNSLFDENCNSCICSKDGKSAACTAMVCPERHVEEFCKPGKQFQMDDLSTCICNKDGITARCTLGLQACGKSRHLTKNSQYCTPGSTFSPDNCNTCLCSQDGSNALCTLQMCPVEKPKQVCEPRKSFKDYCNTCFCDDDGSSYSCTKMLCDKNIWNQDGSMKVLVGKSAAKQVCEPRKAFNDYCNTCICSDDGLSAVCTRIWCDKNIWNQDGTTKVQLRANVEQVCEPRKSFKDYCNTCVCSEDGSSFACTRMHCNKNIWNEDGTTKVIVKSAEARVCTPNSHFKEQCNACICSDDGLSKFCTMMSCNAFDSEPENQVCSPRSTFSPDGCNTCKCNEFGNDYVCTFKMCPESYGKSRTISQSENWGPLYKQGDLCPPGKVFYSECNQCVCTKNGRNAFCTLMNCHNIA